MRVVHPYPLYLGNVVDSWDIRGILRQGIAAVVDLAGNEPLMQATRDLTYLRFPFVDGAGNSPWMIRLCVDSVVHLVQHEVPTFLYCSAGMSRSPVIAAAAIAKISCSPLTDCLAELCREQPSDVSSVFLRDVVAACGLPTSP